MRVMQLLLILLLPAGSVWSAETTPLQVFVSVPPQRSLVEAIGGAAVQVTALVQAGQNPHYFEPTPRQIATLAEADLYVGIGIPFEDTWMPRFQALNPGMQVLDLGADPPPANMLAAQTGEHEHEHEHRQKHSPEYGHAPDHHDHATDPHLWTSPPALRLMLPRISAALAELDPHQAATFAANAQTLDQTLATLDQSLRQSLADLEQRRFLVFHPAWGAFAATYGLEQLAIEIEGKEPGPRSLARVIDEARAAGIHLILVQPQYNPAPAQQVAEAIGARLLSLDPLAPDYMATLRQLASAIAGSTP